MCASCGRSSSRHREQKENRRDPLLHSDSKLIVSAVSAVAGASFYPDPTYTFDVVLEEGSKKHVGYKNVSGRNLFECSLVS